MKTKICFLLILLSVFLPNFIFNNPDSALPFFPEAISISLFLIVLALQPIITLTRVEAFLVSGVFLILTMMGLSAWSDYHSSPQYCSSLSFPLYLECLGMSSDLISTAPRQFYYLFTSIMIALCSFLYTRNHKKSNHLINALICGALIITTCEIFAHFYGIKSLLPEFLRYDLEKWNHQATAWFGNPGWGWPYLSLIATLLTWKIIYHKKKNFLDYTIALLSLISFHFLILLSLQRSVALFYILQFFVFIHIYLQKYKLYSQKTTRYAIGIIFILLTFCFYFFYQNIILQVQGEARFTLWLSAFQMLFEYPFQGIGYANWFNSIQDYLHTHPDLSFSALAKPTAHNLFVQNLVELGLFQFLIIYAYIYLIFKHQVFNKKNPAKIKNLALLLLATIITANIFQNMTYIRPIMFNYAIAIGFLLGLSSEKPKKTDIHINKLTIKALSVLFLSFGLWFSQTISLGIYAFEKDEYQNLRRWLSPTSTLKISNHQTTKMYQEYTITPIMKDTAEIKTSSFHGFLPLSDQKIIFPFDLHQNFISQPQKIFFTKYIQENTRRLSSWLTYTGEATNLAVFSNEKLGSWEKNHTNQRLWRWCENNCSFIAKSCGKKDQVQFTLILPPQAPKTTQIEIETFSVNTHTKPWVKKFEQYQRHISSGNKSSWDLIFENPQKNNFLFSIKSTYHYKPQDYGAQDPRILIAKIEEPEC
ncbi:MAG: O-antigen ligase family protein [Oligoflexales bacterium]